MRRKPMCRRRLLPLFLFVLCCLSVAGQTTPSASDAPARTVKGRVLTSTELPAARLEFGKSFKYVGGHSFILYNVARAEQHFFVDADKDGRIKRLYWVQFEGYLADNTHSYNYKGPKTVNIGGLDFFADVYARNIRTNPGRPDSDAAKGRAFLESKGFRLGSDETLSQRLLHFIGKDKRNELMIIYLEDLSPTGMTSADLAQGGKDAAKWPAFSEAVLERAIKDLKIVPGK
jgi:hypothetical protein